MKQQLINVLSYCPELTINLSVKDREGKQVRPLLQSGELVAKKCCGTVIPFEKLGWLERTRMKIALDGILMA